MGVDIIPGLKKTDAEPEKKKRGRPKKSEQAAEPVKKRGRPRKAKAEPVVETIEEAAEVAAEPELPMEEAPAVEKEEAAPELPAEEPGDPEPPSEEEKAPAEEQSEPLAEPPSEAGDEPPAEEQPEPPAEAGDFALEYDFTSGERYVDSTSQKTEFDKMLDELGEISKDMLSWEVEKFTRKYPGDGDEALKRKFEAFLGGFITNAAMELYDRGYQDAAFQCLDQVRNILEAKRKLEDEVASIKAKQEEDAVDLTDLLGL